MTGIHHTAPATYLRATRQQADTIRGNARRPGRLLLSVRRLTGRVPASLQLRWMGVTPAKAAR